MELGWQISTSIGLQTRSIDHMRLGPYWSHVFQLLDQSFKDLESRRGRSACCLCFCLRFSLGLDVSSHSTSYLLEAVDLGIELLNYKRFKSHGLEK